MPCPLCETAGAKRFTVQRGFRWYRCGRCGLLYLSPRPGRDELTRAYQGYLPTDAAGIDAWQRLMEDVFREALRVLGPPAPGRRPRLLDVGCAYGFFVEAAHAAGWDARGIDLSEQAVARARTRGLRVELAGIEDSDFPAESFDVVTLFYVLEHVADPVAVARRVRECLRPGGRVLLRVPHTGPLVSALDALGIRNELLDPPFHLSDFSPAALRALLERAGFTGVRTFPGASTRPRRATSRVIARLSSALATGLHVASGGSYLLPGVSKTTVAQRPRF